MLHHISPYQSFDPRSVHSLPNKHNNDNYPYYDDRKATPQCAHCGNRLGWPLQTKTNPPALVCSDRCASLYEVASVANSDLSSLMGLLGAARSADVAPAPKPPVVRESTLTRSSATTFAAGVKGAEPHPRVVRLNCCVYVLDTNVLLDELDFILTAAYLFEQCESDTPQTKPRFVIPWRVAWELDKHKGDRRDAERQRKAALALSRLINYENSLKDRIVRETFEDTRRPGVVRYGGDRAGRDGPDEEIFQTAFALMKTLFRRAVAIVTNDLHLRAICGANGLVKASAKGIVDSLTQLFSGGNVRVVFGPPSSETPANSTALASPSPDQKRTKVLESIRHGIWRAGYWLWDDPLPPIRDDVPDGEALLDIVRKSSIGPHLHIKLVGKCILTSRKVYLNADLFMAPVLRIIFNWTDIQQEGALKYYLSWRRRIAPS